MESARLLKMTGKYNIPVKDITPFEKAFDTAREEAEKDNAVLLVAGSLFAAAAARDCLQETGFVIKNFQTSQEINNDNVIENKVNTNEI
jgi:hypothetical protein